MCCFAGPIVDVSATRIFARLSGQGTQYLAYQMRYASARPNAMILPLPVTLPAAEKSIRFIDLSDYGDFFAHLERAFPVPVRRSIACSAQNATTGIAGILEVHEVGNFIASFVPTMQAFDRLDPQFSISSDIWSQIPEYKDYGFAVFQLKELSGEPHPMAFEFATRLNETYFPTVHIHDGQVHREEEFDHVLYMQHAGFDSIVGPYVSPNSLDKATDLVRSKYAAGEKSNIEKARGVLHPDLLVHRAKLKGRHENKDTIFASLGSPLVPTLNLRLLYRFWPVALVASAAVWLIQRRTRLRKSRSQTSQ